MSKDNATPPPTVASSDMPSKEEMEAISVMKDEELEWLFETPKQGSKFFTKAKENPFVPIGKKLFMSNFFLAQPYGCNYWRSVDIK